uniref:Uncharacterized protein n=1 Tax=Solanum lycopersicum TaxID=4081 RepID=A0A3Q7F9C6_SOLLC
MLQARFRTSNSAFIRRRRVRPVRYRRRIKTP